MSTFQPSEYSCGFQAAANPKTDTSKCDHFKTDQKNYRKLMATAGLFTKTRRAFELKANASKKEYLSCKKLLKAKPKEKTKAKIAAKKKELGMKDEEGTSIKSPSMTDIRAKAAETTTSDASITAADATGSDSGIDSEAGTETSKMPLFLLAGGVVILGGLGYALYHSKHKDSHKKQKIKHVVNIHMPTHGAAEPPVVK